MKQTRLIAMRRVKAAIYVVVFLYSSHVIVNGVTYFSEWEADIIFTGILSATVIALVIWLGYEMKVNPKNEIAN